MIVDDSPEDLELALLAFESSGLRGRIETASCGEEALACLLGPQRGERPLPRVLVLDIMMPRVTGFDVLRSLRSDPSCKALKIVMLTSSLEPVDVQRAAALGADLYFRKPVRFEQFEELARAIELLADSEDRRPV